MEAFETQLTVRVDYQEGLSIVLYVITEGSDWKIYQYNPSEG